VSSGRSWPSDPTARPALRIDGTDVIRILRDIVDTLSQSEAGVVTMRLGLNDGEPKTLDEIGKAYGVTRERIKQIEQRAMFKLRQALSDSPLTVTEGGTVLDIVDVRRAAVDASTPPKTLVWCANCHERRFDQRSGVPTGGRPRKYCSDKCRQAAYRARQRPTGRSRPTTPTEKSDKPHAVSSGQAER
jgi:cytochrome c553